MKIGLNKTDRRVNPRNALSSKKKRCFILWIYNTAKVIHQIEIDDFIN